MSIILQFLLLIYLLGVGVIAIYSLVRVENLDNQKGEPLGIATLNDQAEVPVAQIPTTISTDLSNGLITATTYEILSSTGDPVTLQAADGTLQTCGVMTSDDKTKLDGIAAGAQVNQPTNLGQGTSSATSLELTSSTGSSTTLSGATDSSAGLMVSTDKDRVDTIDLISLSLPYFGSQTTATVSSIIFDQTNYDQAVPTRGTIATSSDVFGSYSLLGMNLDGDDNLPLYVRTNFYLGTSPTISGTGNWYAWNVLPYNPSGPALTPVFGTTSSVLLTSANFSTYVISDPNLTYDSMLGKWRFVYMVPINTGTTVSGANNTFYAPRVNGTGSITLTA